MSERRSKSRPSKSSARRRLILEHARELFARHGYAATTMAQLAESSGLTPSALSKLYADRTAIIRGLVEEFRRDLATVVKSVPDDADWSEKLQAIFRAFRVEARPQATPARVLLRLLAEGDSEVRAAMTESLTPSIQSIAELVRGGQQAGVFRRTIDAEQAAWEIIRTFFGLALLDRVEPALPDDSDHSSVGIECLLHGLLKTDV